MKRKRVRVKKKSRLSGKSFVAKMKAAKAAKARRSKRGAKRHGTSKLMAGASKRRVAIRRQIRSETDKAHRELMKRAKEKVKIKGNPRMKRKKSRKAKRRVHRRRKPKTHKRRKSSHRRKKASVRRRRVKHMAPMTVVSNPRRRRRHRKARKASHRKHRRIRRRHNPFGAVGSAMNQWLGFGVMEAGAFVAGGAIVQLLDEVVNSYAPASLVAIKQSLPASEIYAPILIAAAVHKFSKHEGAKTIASAIVAAALVNLGQDLTSLIPGSAASQPVASGATAGLIQSQGTRAYGGDFHGLMATAGTSPYTGDFRGLVQAPGNRMYSGDFRGKVMGAAPDGAKYVGAPDVMIENAIKRS